MLLEMMFERGGSAAVGSNWGGSGSGRVGYGASSKGKRGCNLGDKIILHGEVQFGFIS